MVRHKPFGFILLPLATVSLCLAFHGNGEEPSGTTVGTQTGRIGYFFRDKVSGISYLKANEFLMGKPVKFHFDELWQYEPREKRWRFVPIETPDDKIIHREARQAYGGDRDQIVFPISDSIGLFWVKWQEDGIRREAFLFAGTMCNDVRPAPTLEEGLVAACIPGRDSATAAYVPDPRLHCQMPER